jgi:nitrite reductase/ring-hydroxylating ferredoxin subunit
MPDMRVVSEAWHRVAAAGEIPEGTMRGFVIEGREVLVGHGRFGWFALDNVCTHAHARLCDGRLRGARLVCPLHGASFDVRDGRVLAPPATTPLAVHRVRIAGGGVEVALGAG